MPSKSLQGWRSVEVVKLIRKEALLKIDFVVDVRAMQAFETGLTNADRSGDR